MKTLNLMIFALILSGCFGGSIEDTTCSDVQKDTTGMELKNTFGGSFTILSVRNSREISRSKDKLVCIGDARLDNGSSPKLRMELTFDGNEFWLQAEVL
tara:strand:+ start:71 stop:367 length:297 start_codon:yes stop_codon:yes gene_type:complete